MLSGHLSSSFFLSKGMSVPTLEGESSICELFLRSQLHPMVSPRIPGAQAAQAAPQAQYGAGLHDGLAVCSVDCSAHSEVSGLGVDLLSRSREAA